MNLILNSNSVRPQWTSSNSYLLVTLGAVVGIDNLLIFPFLIFKYGGLFLLFYLLCEIGIALPLLYAELMIGRRGKQNPVGAINLLCLENKASFKWSKLGWLYFAIAFLTFSYYVVYAALPAGFVIDGLKAFYVSHASGQIGKLDTHLLGNPYVLESCVIVLMLLAIFVVAKGINRGLERISTITVPLYFFILCGLTIHMLFVSSPLDALKDMFSIKPDASLFVVFFAALSFAFLKFNVGMGSMVLYGSYLPYATSLKRSTLWIVLFDLMISLLAYFISYGLIKSLNPSLFLTDFSNQNVTAIFGNIPNSIMISVLFFSAACLAVWTVLIAMLETMTATLSEQLGISHAKAIALLSIGLLLLASLLVITQTTLWDEKLLTYSVHASWIKRTALEILTPMAVLLMAIFSSWVVDRETSQSELRFGPIAYGLWRFFMRYVIPVCMIVIFVYGVTIQHN